MQYLTVLDLLGLELKARDDLKLNLIAGRPGLGRKITNPNINRPGLALAGFFENFAYDRVQVFGKGELSYIAELKKNGKLSFVEKMLSYEIPCCITTSIEDVEDYLIDLCNKYNVPLISSDLNSTDFSVKIISALADFFAPKKVVHATLIEVFGIGVLIKGDSGIGKSETALDLIVRGHRLIADDAVEIRALSGDILVGHGSSNITKHHLEVRGLGILNINHLFGVGSIRDKKQIQLIVKLEEWNADKSYDRFGAIEQQEEILGIKIPYVEIPVKSGRNIPILVEVAAMNERLKKLGYHSAQEFNENMLNWLENKSSRELYFQNKEKF